MSDKITVKDAEIGVEVAFSVATTFNAKSGRELAIKIDGKDVGVNDEAFRTLLDALMDLHATLVEFKSNTQAWQVV